MGKHFAALERHSGGSRAYNEALQPQLEDEGLLSGFNYEAKRFQPVHSHHLIHEQWLSEVCRSYSS